jgi:hypothetical protein
MYGSRYSICHMSSAGVVDSLYSYQGIFLKRGRGGAGGVKGGGGDNNQKSFISPKIGRRALAIKINSRICVIVELAFLTTHIAGWLFLV